MADARTPPVRQQRHGLTARLYHWSLAACVYFLVLTGFSPVMGIRFPWVEPHWIAGLLLSVLVIGHIGYSSASRRYRIMAWVSGQGAEPRKYTDAQKLYHWAIGSLLTLLVATGIVLTMGIDSVLGRADPHMLGPWWRGVMFACHGMAALCCIPLILVHTYLALLPENSWLLRSMVHGHPDRRSNHGDLSAVAPQTDGGGSRP